MWSRQAIASWIMSPVRTVANCTEGPGNKKLSKPILLYTMTAREVAQAWLDRAIQDSLVLGNHQYHDVEIGVDEDGKAFAKIYAR